MHVWYPLIVICIFFLSSKIQFIVSSVRVWKCKFHEFRDPFRTIVEIVGKYVPFMFKSLLLLFFTLCLSFLNTIFLYMELITYLGDESIKVKWCLDNLLIYNIYILRNVEKYRSINWLSLVCKTGDEGRKHCRKWLKIHHVYFFLQWLQPSSSA